LVEGGEGAILVRTRLLDEARAFGDVLVRCDLEERSGVGNAYA
jgi:hypothetical protein